MKCLFLKLFLIFVVSNADAQYCIGNRFSESPVFSDSDIDSIINGIYGNASDWLGQTQDLTFNAYFPKESIDPLMHRPFILLIHGGGYIEGSKEELNFECREFAKRGFVAFTIDYRLCVGCDEDTLPLDRAAYIAMQDAHASLRYAVANALSFGIDTTWLFAGGQSAGAGTALGLVYFTQDDWNTIKPSLQLQLGNLNNSGNTFTSGFKVKGVINEWGAMLKAVVNITEMVPMVSFHGEADSVAPIDSAVYVVNGSTALAFGSRTLHNLVSISGVCSNLQAKTGGGHGVYDTTPAQKIFRVNKVSCFLKSLFCYTCASIYETDSLPSTCSSMASSVNALSRDSEIIIYPNPAQEYFFVDLPVQKHDIMIADVSGRIIHRLRDVEGKIKVSCTSLPDGMYFVQVRNDKEVISSNKLFIKK